MSTAEGILSGTGLVKSFGSTVALQNVSLEIQPGEIVALTGRSGSGKSTLLLCLSGILLPDEGEVVLGNTPVHTMSEDQRSRLRRTDFGMLFQFGQLVSELSAEENVALPLLLGGTGRKAAIAAARSGLTRVGVGDLADRRPTQMSGGQAQRVALARAMITRPRVLFADEPTGALDQASGQLVLEAIQSAAHEDGTAVVLVTHDESVAALADRQFALEDGRELAFDR